MKAAALGVGVGVDALGLGVLGVDVEGVDARLGALLAGAGVAEVPPPALSEDAQEDRAIARAPEMSMGATFAARFVRIRMFLPTARFPAGGGGASSRRRGLRGRCCAPSVTLVVPSAALTEAL